MAKYKLTNKAVSDLKRIWNYTFDNWSEKQADKYYNMLIDNCIQISKNPSLGKNYPDIFEDILGLRVGKHIIFYLENQNYEIEVVRILHEQMDLKDRIKEK